MKSLPATRSLRLETLESRCLLAGGVFLFSHDVDHRPSERHSGDLPADTHRTADAHRTAEIRRATDGQPGRPSHGRGDRGHQRWDASFATPPIHRLEPIRTPTSSRSQATQTSTFSTITMVWTQPEASESATPAATSASMGTNPPRAASEQSLASVSDEVPRVQPDLPPSPDATLPQLNAAALPSGANASSQRPNDARIAQDAQGLLSVADTDHSAGGNQQASELDSIAARRFLSDVSSPGETPLIDSLPLRRQAPLPDQPLDPQPAWELGEDTLRRLQAVAEPTEHSAEQDAMLALDAIVATWFDGPGGLIELAGERVPLIDAQALDQIVAVELDAGLGLHRSLGLLAAATPQPGEHDIRAAILNAIARADSGLAAPIRDQAPARASALTLPGIVLVAGSLAMAARCRRAC